MAYADPAARVRAFAPMTSWARLLAATGLAAAVYGAESPTEDVHAVLRHVRAEAEDLGVDAGCIALVASSGNATVSLATLMADSRISCAAFLYPYTMDLDGHTEVDRASATFRFAVPGAGRSLADVPADVPLLLVRAGADQMPGLNAALDRFALGLLARNAPVTLVNHATGPHAFDLEDDGPAAAAAIRQVLAFLASLDY